MTSIWLSKEHNYLEITSIVYCQDIFTFMLFFFHNKCPRTFPPFQVTMKFLYALLVLGILASVEAGGYGRRPRPRPSKSNNIYNIWYKS